MATGLTRGDGRVGRVQIKGEGQGWNSRRMAKGEVWLRNVITPLFIEWSYLMRRVPRSKLSLYYSQHVFITFIELTLVN